VRLSREVWGDEDEHEPRLMWGVDVGLHGATIQLKQIVPEL
jgi:hypothetical protein